MQARVVGIGIYGLLIKLDRFIKPAQPAQDGGLVEYHIDKVSAILDYIVIFNQGFLIHAIIIISGSQIITGFDAPGIQPQGAAESYHRLCGHALSQNRLPIGCVDV